MKIGFSGDVRRQAGWLPYSQEALEDWLAGHRMRVASEGPDVRLHSAVADFAHLVASDPVLGMYVARMIEQVPRSRAYSKRHLEDTEQLMRMINAVLTIAPEFGDENVMLPLEAILDWTMGTPAGFAAYRDPRMNGALKAILTAWCKYLTSSASLYVLNDSPSGWMCEAAQLEIGIEQYEHDPSALHWGFTSWNDFFTRRLREGARPIASPSDDDIIVAACESTPFSIRTDVKRRDQFWLKTQPYSLEFDCTAGQTVVPIQNRPCKNRSEPRSGLGWSLVPGRGSFVAPRSFEVSRFASPRRDVFPSVDGYAL